jgi:general stress protein 26
MSPDDPAVVEILRRAMVARIATLSRNGRPHVNPIYFVYVDGRIQLGTLDRTLAALNVRANPRVRILFNIERKPADRRVLLIEGQASVRSERGIHRSYVGRVVFKYILTPRGMRNLLAHFRLLPVMRRYESSREKGQPCVLEVVPERAEWLAMSRKLP